MKNNIETIDYIELSEPKERYFITDIIFIIFLLFCLSAYIHYSKLELHNVENKERSFQQPTEKIAPVPHFAEFTPPTYKTFTDYQIATWHLKAYEGIRLVAYVDGIEHGKTRYSIGWGTRSHKGEVITVDQANERHGKAFEKRYQYIKNRYPNLSRWKHLILATVRYNVGSFGTELDAAIKANDFDKVAKILRHYNKNSEGAMLIALSKRRKTDIKLLQANEVVKQDYGRQVQAVVTRKIKKQLEKLS